MILGDSMLLWTPYSFSRWIFFVTIIANLLFVVFVLRKETAVKEEKVPLNAENAINNLAEEYHLTGREKEVIMELYQGQSNAEIAEKLFISERTVKAHIHNSLQKMGMANRVEVICRIREMIDG